MMLPTSKTFRLAALPFLAIAVCPLVTDAARAEDTEAWKFYQQFLAVCKTATSIEPLLPFLPEWENELYKMAKENGNADSNALPKQCESVKKYKNVTYQSEEPEGDDVLLHLKSMWDDLAMDGEITLVREDDGLKVDIWIWNVDMAAP